MYNTHTWIERYFKAGPVLSDCDAAVDGSFVIQAYRALLEWLRQESSPRSGFQVSKKHFKEMFLPRPLVEIRYRHPPGLESSIMCQTGSVIWFIFP